MRVSRWPRFFATTISGTPAMAARLAQVWRRPWKLICGVIFARLQAAAINRDCCDRPQGWPSARNSIVAWPGRPAQTCLKNAAPSSVNTTCRDLPLLLSRIASVPASGLKSCTCNATSSPSRAPVSSAACTSSRKSGSQPLSSRCASATVRYRMRAVLTFSNGWTRDHSAFEATLPSLHAMLSAALSVISVLFTVTLRARLASALSSSAYCCFSPSRVRSRAGVLAMSAIHFRSRSAVSLATSMSPSTGRMNARSRARTDIDRNPCGCWVTVDGHRQRRTLPRLIQSGKLRALATTSSKRIPELPELPTMIESGFAGFVSTSWTGLLAPAHTPHDVIDKLNVQINEGLKSAELRSALGKLSNQPLGGTPQDFTDMIKGDIGKWAPIVKALGLTAG